MSEPRARRARRLGVAAFVACTTLLVGCATTPQNPLSPDGPIARKEHRLFVPVIGLAGVVFVLVEGLIVVAVLRYRHRPGDTSEPTQNHGNTKLEIGWTILPAAILAVVAVPTVATLFDINREPKGAIPVTVIGHQWWWEYRYPTLGVVTANEMHLPTGRPLRLTLESFEPRFGPKAQGVIHSFWIPRLAGKQDVVPGHKNKLTLQADEPGTFLGQCAEFCGISHANMRARAIAQTPADFDAWVAAQRRAAAPPVSGDAAAGSELFKTKGCVGCHTINTGGGNEGATVGPNLTHLQSRTTFAGSIFEMSPANLAKWLADPPKRKPGSIMPNLHLKPDEIRSLVAYLETLE